MSIRISSIPVLSVWVAGTVRRGLAIAAQFVEGAIVRIRSAE